MSAVMMTAAVASLRRRRRTQPRSWLSHGSFARSSGWSSATAWRSAASSPAEA